MDNKNFFSKIGANKLYLAIGGVLLVAIVAGAMFLPGTLFRGLLPQYQLTTTQQLQIALNVQCEVDPSPAYVNQNVTFTSKAVGGTKPYTYAWTALSASPEMPYTVTWSTLTVKFAQEGSHVVRTYVTDDAGTMKWTECPVEVISPPPLSLQCEVDPNPARTNEQIVFKAKVTDGTTPYKYEWNIGQWMTKMPKVSADLTKDQITADFSEIEPGDFKFFLYVEDSSPVPTTANAECNFKTVAPPLTATCAVNPTTIKAGDTVTWTASPTGGDGTYSYLWVGDKIDGKITKSVLATFTQQPLTENYRVIVSSAGTTSTITCPKLTYTATVQPPAEPAVEEKPGVPSKCPGIDYPTDITGHWAEDYIIRGYDYCLFKGVGGKFFPDRNATRIEAASMILYSKDKQPSATCTTLACLTPFTDLQNAEQGAILNPLYFEDLIQGYPNNQFRPQSLITRAEAASLIVRAFFEPYGPSCYDPHCGAGWPDNFFLDITETWQGKYIRVLWDLRIMTGAGPNKVEPNRSITRAEMAKMIVLAYEETN